MSKEMVWKVEDGKRKEETESLKSIEKENKTNRKGKRKEKKIRIGAKKKNIHKQFSN